MSLWQIDHTVHCTRHARLRHCTLSSIDLCNDDDDDDDNDDIAAYEYVPDSEECCSESTISSTHEALIEPATEEITERGSDEVVMMADVQWCLRSLLEAQQTELASVINTYQLTLSLMKTMVCYVYTTP